MNLSRGHNKCYFPILPTLAGGLIWVEERQEAIKGEFSLKSMLLRR